jgi:hypothetical protein
MMFEIPSLLVEAGRGDLRIVPGMPNQLPKSSKPVPEWSRPQMHADAVLRGARETRLVAAGILANGPVVPFSGPKEIEYQQD